MSILTLSLVSAYISRLRLDGRYVRSVFRLLLGRLLPSALLAGPRSISRVWLVFKASAPGFSLPALGSAPVEPTGPSPCRAVEPRSRFASICGYDRLYSRGLACYSSTYGSLSLRAIGSLPFPAFFRKRNGSIGRLLGLQVSYSYPRDCIVGSNPHSSDVSVPGKTVGKA